MAKYINPTKIITLIDKAKIQYYTQSYQNLLNEEYGLDELTNNTIELGTIRILIKTLSYEFSIDQTSEITYNLYIKLSKLINIYDIGDYTISKNLQHSAPEFIFIDGIGVTSFINLTDTPNSYTGQAGKTIVVNDTEDGLIFTDGSEINVEDLPLYDTIDDAGWIALAPNAKFKTSSGHLMYKTGSVKTDPVITFTTNPEVIYGDDEVILSATSTNVSEPIYFESSDTDVVFVWEANGIWRARYLGIGFSNIVAKQLANIEYNAGISTPVAVEVNEIIDADAENYFNRITAAGGSIDYMSKQKASRVFYDMKQFGIYDDVYELYLFSGNDLLSSLVKAKYKTGLPSTLSNSGFLDSDYSISGGLKGDGLGKKLGTGVIPLNDLDNYNLGISWAYNRRPFVDGNKFFLNAGVPELTFTHNGKGRSEYFNSTDYAQTGEFEYGKSAIQFFLSAGGNKSITNYGIKGSSSGGTAAFYSGTEIYLYGSGGTSEIAFSCLSIGDVTADMRKVFKKFAKLMGRIDDTVIFAGDSLTAGADGERYCNQTLSLINKEFVNVNFGVSGYTFIDMMNLALENDNYRNFIDSDSIYVLYGGTNDFAKGSSSATVYNNMLSLINYVKGLGVTKFVLGTVCGYDGAVSSYDVERAIYNQKIKDEAINEGWIVADFASTSLNVWNSGDFRDAVHWSAIGCSKAAVKAAEAMEIII